jgi:CheY-like chemotaxis protein
VKELDVIVVEDNELDMFAVTNALSCAGVRFLTINDSTKAMEAAIKHQPDLAILDYRMPEKDGITLCKELARDARTEHIEIIFLSAADNIDDLLLGANIKHVSAHSKSRPILELISSVVARKLGRDCSSDIHTFRTAHKEIINQLSH